MPFLALVGLPGIPQGFFVRHAPARMTAWECPSRDRGGRVGVLRLNRWTGEVVWCDTSTSTTTPIVMDCKAKWSA
jgi:hypothetical protein